MRAQVVFCRLTQVLSSTGEVTEVVIKFVREGADTTDMHPGLDADPTRALELALRDFLEHTKLFPGIDKTASLYHRCNVGVAKICQTHSVRLFGADDKEVSHALSKSFLTAALQALAQLYAKEYGLTLELPQVTEPEISSSALAGK